MVAGEATADVDVLVIGAGPAGYVAAIRAGQLGQDVALVEKNAHGGTCLNHGCIPSKALITATDVAYDAGHAEAMGVYADPTVDFGELIEWKDGIVEQLTDGVEKLCKANGVSLLEGTAQFVDEHAVEITVNDGSQERLSFEHAIVATGSRPIRIPNFDPDDEPVLDSRQALALESVPDSMAIVGAGYIGMELAGVFAKLGSDVTIIELLDDVLPRYDDELTRPVKERASELGIEFEFGSTASAWHEREDGIRVEATPAGDADESAAEIDIDVERVLVAVGREPVTDTLALEHAGVETDENGFIVIDDQARSSVDHIFAVGDVAGEPLLAHAGTAEGQVAAEVIAGEPAALDYQAMPAAVFTDPEIATVGMTDADAADAGIDPLVGRFPFRASGRALTTGSADGFVEIVADAESEFVLGGRAVGPEASELIAEIGLAIEMGAYLEDVAGTIHAHPTLSEATMEAAENALDRAIHTVNR